MMSKHKIGIVWGEYPSNSEYQLQEYSFNTQAELDAFLLGAYESNGWFGYNVIGKNGDFATLDDLKKEFE